MPYDRRVRGRVPDKNGVEKVVPIPPVQATVNALLPMIPVQIDLATSAVDLMDSDLSASPQGPAQSVSPTSVCDYVLLGLLVSLRSLRHASTDLLVLLREPRCFVDPAVAAPCGHVSRYRQVG